MACRIILRRRSHGQTIKKNIESRKYSFRPPGGLALWSLAARLAARAWSLPDDSTRVRSPSRCSQACSDSPIERNNEEYE
ncbi:hypothetical protein BO443_100035 [Burkholderia orbicola]